MTIEPLEISLPQEDEQRVGRGVELYCRHLDGLKEGAEKMGLTADAANYEKKAAGLREELVTPVLESGMPLIVYPRHRDACRRGLEYLSVRLKAAKGTMKGVGKLAMVRELDQDAAWVDSTLIPEFTDQAELGLVGADAPVAVSDDGAQKLKAAAEAGAAEAVPSGDG